MFELIILCLIKVYNSLKYIYENKDSHLNNLCILYVFLIGVILKTVVEGISDEKNLNLYEPEHLFTFARMYLQNVYSIF